MPVAPNDKSFIFGGIFMLANRMQTVGDSVAGELTVKQWFLLLVVRDLPDGSSIADVAGDAGTTRQNVKKLLEQLAAKGYVQLKPSPADKRSTAVHMTEKGRAYMKEISIQGGKFIGRMFEGVAGNDIAAARRMMAQLIENLEDMRPEHIKPEEKERKK